MFRYLLLGSLLLSLPATAQRAKVTKATVFTDASGQVLTWKQYQGQLRTGKFTTYDPQVRNGVIQTISLMPVGTPEKPRAQALSKRRTYGTPVPDFDVADVNGRRYALAELRGKVVVLNFWFIKCAYCQEEMPELRKLTADYRANPNVVFVSFAREDAAKLRRYLADQGDFGYAVLPLPPALAESFGITGYPTSVVVGPGGEYVYDSEGYGGNLLRLREAIEQARR